MSETIKKVAPKNNSNKKKKKLKQSDIPSVIKVFGREIKVKLSDLKNEYGIYSDMEQVITIDKKLSPENAEKVLWHEACHAAFALSGASEHLSQETEEMLAIMLENAFYDIVDVWKLSVKNN